jgi:hypothetical protein
MKADLSASLALRLTSGLAPPPFLLTQSRHPRHWSGIQADPIQPLAHIQGFKAQAPLPAFAKTVVVMTSPEAQPDWFPLA